MKLSSGWLSTDENGDQKIWSKKPKKLENKKSTFLFRNVPEYGHWTAFGYFVMKIGNNVYKNHTWGDKPIKVDITLEEKGSKK